MTGAALNHEIRRAIVSLLRDGEMTAGAIAAALGRARPGVSHHLSYLLDVGIVTCRADGAHRYYALDMARTLEAWNEYLLAPGSVAEDV